MAASPVDNGVPRTDRLAMPAFDMYPGLAVAASTIIEAARRLTRDRTSDLPVVVALDGGSGSGKSTLGAFVAASLDAAYVQVDDFFAAEIPDAAWDAYSPRERAAAAIDWRRLRSEAIEPLLRRKVASWHPFDFAAGTRPDGTYPRSTELTTCAPAPSIVLDGAYSCRPELADLIDLAVLVDVPTDERHRRISSRDPKAFSDAWHARWDVAEDYYFTHVRPPSAFDLVVSLEP